MKPAAHYLRCTTLASLVTLELTHLVLGIPCQDIQARDMQPKLFRLGELSQAHAERDEVGARDGDGLAHEGLANVVDAGPVEAEHVGLQLGVSWQTGERAE